MNVYASMQPVRNITIVERVSARDAFKAAAITTPPI